MRVALAADIAWWGIVLVLVGALGMFAGGLMVALGVVDILRPRVQSRIAALGKRRGVGGGVTSPNEHRRRVIAAVGFAILWSNVLLDPVD